MNAYEFLDALHSRINQRMAETEARLWSTTSFYGSTKKDDENDFSSFLSEMIYKGSETYKKEFLGSLYDGALTDEVRSPFAQANSTDNFFSGSTYSDLLLRYM